MTAPRTRAAKHPNAVQLHAPPTEEEEIMHGLHTKPATEPVTPPFDTWLSLGSNWCSACRRKNLDVVVLFGNSERCVGICEECLAMIKHEADDYRAELARLDGREEADAG